MKQFQSHRKRLFRRKGLRLRNIVMPASAFLAVYAGLHLIFDKDQVTAANTTLSLKQQALMTPRQMVSAAPSVPARSAQVDTRSAQVSAVRSASATTMLSASADTMKLAFDAQPQISTVKAEESAPLKVAIATAQPVRAGKIASIQTGISSILEAGGKMLVSQKKLVIGKGDTLMDILVKKASVPREDAYQAVIALSKVYNPRDLNVGHQITVFFHQDPSVADPKFSGIQIEKDIVNTVSVNRAGNGDFTVQQHEKDVHRTVKGFKGQINNSLYVDAQAKGVPDSVILDLIKMYSYNVDFQRELHTGDGFEVMYEEYMTEDGHVVSGKGNIIYAKLDLGDRALPFYRYEDKSGSFDYYDDKGFSAKKALMKTPIDGARLTSGFGMRHHPVLGYNKMHKGIDFAAARGTPIYASGDGVIEKLERSSSYGNYIRIRHRNDLKTAYAHMNGFKAGMHNGSRVKQGEVIGYVGTTGRSTGPHLHYEIIVNNTQVNPATVKMAMGKSLDGKALKTFASFVAKTRVQFKGLSQPSAVAASGTGVKSEAMKAVTAQN